MSEKSDGGAKGRASRVPGIDSGGADVERDEQGMRLALREARTAWAEGEVPTGCVIVEKIPDAAESVSGGAADGFRLLSRAFNQTERLRDPTAHAERIAITRAAAARGDWRLTDTILYVTKEPCAMCAGAIVLARIPRVVFGVSDPRRGGAVSLFNILRNPALNHRCEVIGGILEADCRALLQGFFRDRREAPGDRPAPGGHSIAARAAPRASSCPGPGE